MELGHTVQCEELVTGQRNAAVFELRKDRLFTEVYRFDEYLRVPNVDWLYLRTAQNEFVSLRGNLTSTAGHSTRFYPTTLNTYRQEISSSTAVIGPDRWLHSDRVHAVGFSVPGCGAVFDHDELLQTVTRAKFGLPEENKLFSIDAVSCQIDVSLVGSHQVMRGITTDVQPRFMLRLGEPGSLNDAYLRVMEIVEFISLVMGRALQPEAISLWRGPLPDLTTAASLDETVGPYACHFLWPALDPDQEQRGYLGRAYTAWDDEELPVLRDALGKWMSRATAWHAANQMMMWALRSRNEITSERLVNACKWLEEVPGAEFHESIPIDRLRLITSAAQAEAKRLELGALCARIQGALIRLKSETHEQRFQRLVTEVEERFGTRLIRDGFVQDLLRGLRYRGTAAHGHLTISGETRFREFYRGIAAIEALCFLLTLKQLPPSPYEGNRLSQHVFLHDYLIAY